MTARRRIRFSIRTLLVLVALVAIYFGSWPWARQRAFHDVHESAARSDSTYVTRHLLDKSAIAPYVLRADVVKIDLRRGISPGITGFPMDFRTEYYVWLAGMAVKLPYERARQRRKSVNTFLPFPKPDEPLP